MKSIKIILMSQEIFKVFCMDMDFVIVFMVYNVLMYILDKNMYNYISAIKCFLW